jgi:gamma-polyglutamate synthase
MKLILLLLLLLTSLGLWEMGRHVLHRRRIPLRIHINGSRGKSSVARLIAAGLRAGGIRVVGKTTGSAAAVIHPDGSETPVKRRGGPNIKEQLAVIRGAAREQCEALVIECMAVRPDLQKVCEHTIVKSTHGVITNVRPDHLEVMGPTMDDVATSLAGTVPKDSVLFSSEDHYTDFFANRARKAGSRYVDCPASGVSELEMKKFTYVEFPENVNLALQVCQDVGIKRSVALEAMYDVAPDVGALTRWSFSEIASEGKARSVEFLNGFAANDPDSYVRIWNRLKLNEDAERVLLLMNIRSDRQRRSKDMAPLFGKEMMAAGYVLIGEETAIFADMLKRNGIVGNRIHDLSHLDAVDLWQELVNLSPDQGMVIGVGNIAGIGNRLLDLLRQKVVAA